MPQLINVANVTGQYDSIPVSDTTELFVELNGVSIEKSADKRVWVDDDELVYTILAKNTDPRDPNDPDDPGLPVLNMVVTDTIDTTIAEFVDGSLTVMIGNVPVADPVYTYVDGLLTVTVGEVPAGVTATISFHVEKI